MMFEENIPTLPSQQIHFIPLKFTARHFVGSDWLKIRYLPVARKRMTGQDIIGRVTRYNRSGHADCKQRPCYQTYISLVRGARLARCGWPATSYGGRCACPALALPSSGHPPASTPSTCNCSRCRCCSSAAYGSWRDWRCRRRDSAVAGSAHLRPFWCSACLTWLLCGICVVREENRMAAVNVCDWIACNSDGDLWLAGVN